MRVLILTAHTGGGHDSVAAALAEALGRCSPETSIVTWAPGDDGRRWVPRDLWYDRIVTRLPALWRLFYRLTNRERAIRLVVRLAAVLWEQSLRTTLDAVRPDVVVSVHPLSARLAARVLPTAPYAAAHHCVVTDLMTVHRCWAAPAVAAFYVATPEAAVTLARAGVARAHIHVTGLPLRQQFSTPLPDESHGRVPRVLLLGGGYPGPGLKRAARALLAAEAELDLVIVCGHNTRVRRALAKRVRDRALVLGWRKNIAALMRACDVVVTRAGSVTLAEAFSQGRLVLVYDVLPGQEEGNVALLGGVWPGRQVIAVDDLPAAVQRVWRQGSAGMPRDRAAWWTCAAERVARLVTRQALPPQARPNDPRRPAVVGTSLPVRGGLDAVPALGRAPDPG